MNTGRLVVRQRARKYCPLDEAHSALDWVTQHTLPSPEARPRRIAITSDDVLWYTDYARGYLGRLDPSTGDVREWPSPGGPESQPYGITAVGDIIWYSESSVRPSERSLSWHLHSGRGGESTWTLPRR